MTAPQPRPEWDDSIDLRKWVDALIRYKFLIVGIVVVAVGVAALFSYLVQTPRFESTAGAVLPPANGECGLGFSLRGYQELATSTAVIEKMRQKLGLALAPALVRNQLKVSTEEGEGYISITTFRQAGKAPFQVATDRGERLISVTASGETGEEAFQLATQWIQSYDEQVQTVILRQFTDFKHEATLRIELLLPELALVEDRLTRFDRLAPVSSSGCEGNQGLREKVFTGPSETLGGGGFVEISATNRNYLDLTRRLLLLRLSSLEQGLVDGETLLRELTGSTISIDEARLSFLKDALEAEPRLLTGSVNSSGGAADDSDGKATTGEEMILNPVDLRLAEDQAETRVRLATSRKEAETLKAQNANLREELHELGKKLAEANAIENKLDRRVARFRKAYDPARAELDRLEEIEPRLATISSLSAIREPSLPTSPVAPQRTRTIMLAGVLGLMLGVFAALLLEFYRSTSPSRPSGGE